MIVKSCNVQLYRWFVKIYLLEAASCLFIYAPMHASPFYFGFQYYDHFYNNKAQVYLRQFVFLIRLKNIFSL